MSLIYIFVYAGTYKNVCASEKYGVARVVILGPHPI